MKLQTCSHFAPSSNLEAGTQYTMTLSTNIVDAEGSPLPDNYIWTFTTAAASTSDSISFASQIRLYLMHTALLVILH